MADEPKPKPWAERLNAAAADSPLMQIGLRMLAASSPGSKEDFAKQMQAYQSERRKK